MSEFLRLYRERVDEALKPHQDIYGEDSPVVKMGLRLLAEAESLQRTLEERRVGTQEAARITGWHPETLQKRAREALQGSEPSKGWEDLIVEEAGRGYEFVLGSIPARFAEAG